MPISFNIEEKAQERFNEPFLRDAYIKSFKKHLEAFDIKQNHIQKLLEEEQIAFQTIAYNHLQRVLSSFLQEKCITDKKDKSDLRKAITEYVYHSQINTFSEIKRQLTHVVACHFEINAKAKMASVLNHDERLTSNEKTQITTEFGERTKKATKRAFANLLTDPNPPYSIELSTMTHFTNSTYQSLEKKAKSFVEDKIADKDQDKLAEQKRLERSLALQQAKLTAERKQAEEDTALLKPKELYQTPHSEDNVENLRIRFLELVNYHIHRMQNGVKAFLLSTFFGTQTKQKTIVLEGIRTQLSTLTHNRESLNNIYKQMRNNNELKDVRSLMSSSKSTMAELLKSEDLNTALETQARMARR